MICGDRYRLIIGSNFVYVLSVFKVFCLIDFRSELWIMFISLFPPPSVTSQWLLGPIFASFLNQIPITSLFCFNSTLMERVKFGRERRGVAPLLIFGTFRVVLFSGWFLLVWEVWKFSQITFNFHSDYLFSCLFVYFFAWGIRWSFLISFFICCLTIARHIFTFLCPVIMFK